MNLFEKIEKGEDDIVFVYTICGSTDEARSMGYSSIQEKLAISMDYWVINSMYPWQGVLQEVDQYMAMFSTTKILSKKLVKHLEAEHPYKIPMIVVCSTNMTNLPYSLWVGNTLKDDKKYNIEDELKGSNEIVSLKKLK